MTKLPSLRQNIRPLLSLTWTAAVIFILILILLKEVKANSEVVYLIIGLVSNNVTMILGYYYGASKTQNDSVKNDTTVKQTVETTITSPEPIEPQSL